MDWDAVLGIHYMSLWLPYSAFWDWQVDFGMASLTYFYALHAKFGVSKPIINKLRVVWLSDGLLLQICRALVSLKLPWPKKIVFCIVFGIWMISLHTYLHTGDRIYTYTHTHTWKWYLNLWELFSMKTTYNKCLPVRHEKNSMLLTLSGSKKYQPPSLVKI